MTVEELVTKQQLEIEGMRGLLAEVARLKSSLRGRLVGIGQPLNDNLLMMDRKQLAWCFAIERLVEQLPEQP